MSQATPAARSCTACGATAPDDARYCEACGAELAGVPTAPAAAVAEAESVSLPVAPEVQPGGCRECGAPIDPDGYCTSCGAKAPRPRDHMVEQPQPWVASVSDRGVRHHRNEDAAAIAAGERPGGHAVLVVCDGVSSSQASDVASLAAVRAARDVLESADADADADDPAESSDAATPGRRIELAADAASRAVAASTNAAHGDNPPSCTFVAAVLTDRQVVAGVTGDSRAYWLPDDGDPVMLTEDDSWAAEQIAAGMPRAQAESAPAAHAITRWLGVDAPDHTPRLTELEVAGPGWLLLCSDGLWNYCSPADELADLVRTTAATTSGEPLALCEALVEWANAQGGHDNITVALARVSG